MRLKGKIILNLFPLCLFFVTLISAFLLSSTSVSADDSFVDVISIIIPTSCSLLSSGTTSHNALIPNGNYNSNIGTTEVTAFCNDDEGFAIYAVGFTNDTIGSNVLSSTTLSSDYDIETGIATTGSTSAWAMKLTAPSSPTPTYPISIQSDTEGSFSSFHTVPEEYTLVAKRESSTDVGTNATGSVFTTTYQAYASPTQASGAYVGQVKYILVHPNYVDETALNDAVTVVFDGNGLTFPDGSTTNIVKYARVCEPGNYIYVGNNYQEVKTSNILAGGQQNGSYTDNEYVLQEINLTGADGIKVVVDSRVTGDTGAITIAEGAWSGWSEESPPGRYEEIYASYNDNLSRKDVFFFEGDTITINLQTWDTPESGYDYGFYARIYPVYDTEQPNTTSEPSQDACSIQVINGTYAETTPWKNSWETTLGEVEYSIPLGYYIDYESVEEAVLEYIQNYYETIKGTTQTLYAHNPYTPTYNGNGASNEFGMGTQTYYAGRDSGYLPVELEEGESFMLLAPNYKRTGYGFIGWSTDSNAASHLNTAKLYGPNETVTVDNALLSTANNNNEVTFYAIWLQSSGNLQNWSGCSNLNNGGIVALTDTRDNNTYAIGKHGGNCWMMENLRLGGNNAITLTASDTKSAGILPAATPSNSWGTSDNSQNIYVGNTVAPSPIIESSDYGSNYAYGNSYSFATAINSTTFPSSYSDANTSICPAGWDLPSSSSLSSLRQAISDSMDDDLEDDYTPDPDSTLFPYNFIFSGMTQNGIFSSVQSGFAKRMTVGVLWTRHYAFSYYPEYYYANNLSFNHGDNGIYINFGRSHHGAAVRCLVEL